MARTTEVWKLAVLALASLFAVTTSAAREIGAGAGASAGVVNSEIASPRHSKRSGQIKKKTTQRKRSTDEKKGSRGQRTQRRGAARQ